MKQIFLIMILFWLCNYSGIAQTSVNATGFPASGSGGSLEASIGQVVFQTEYSPSGYLIQGVQQPYEVSVITSNGEYGGRVSLNVFPNPTTNSVTLSIDIADLPGWNFVVFDLSGKTLQESSISSNECAISLEKQPLGTYFLNVYNNSTLAKAFKIIKM